MARLFPEYLPASAPDSERRVFDALRRSLDGSFAVFWSVPWHAAEGKPDGEADFVVAHPELGLLVLEVKGGGINFDAGSRKWLSRDRAGAEHAIEDPFDQALAAKHALIRELRNDPRWPPRRRVQIGYAVFFPDMPITNTGFTARGKREVVLGKFDFDDLAKAIESRLLYWSEVDHGDAPGPDGFSAVVERWGRSWLYSIPLREALVPEEERIVQLTEQQMDVLVALERHRRAAVGGCAGSGKSLLAVAKAQDLARRGNSVLLTCFNKALSMHWQDTLTPVPGLAIRHFHSLCADLVRQTGVRPNVQMGGDAYVRWLPTGLFEALAKSLLRFDAIIVDEGQDFEDDWFESLDLLLSDSVAGTFYVFFDDNQRIYRNDQLPAWLGEPYQLTRNVRNTDQIGEAVKTFYSGSMRLSGVQGRPVRLIDQPIESDGVPGHVIGLRAVIKELREQGADPNDVVVLTPKRNSALSDQKRLGGWTLRSRDHRDGDVLVETIHSFKGLDSAIVILTELDDLSDLADYGKDLVGTLLYVGFSRARSLLVVIAPEWLSTKLAEGKQVATTHS